MTPEALRSRRDAHGRYEQPWAQPGYVVRGLGDLLRWRMQRLRTGVTPDPAPAELPCAQPVLAMPRADVGELRVTWVGHATFLIQLAGVNLLTDPVWSRRASPVGWAGPTRLVPPGIAFAALPPIDVVILSHDHYDHLDARTVRRLHARYGDALTWVAPLGHRSWLEARGIEQIAELDWWQQASVATPGGTVRITATPAQHWSKRTPFSERTRLWASFSIEAGAQRVFFCGDSGYFTGFEAIGAALGPHDLTLLPIGAYEPRWFMKPAHMNPAEAVQAWTDLGATGVMAGMHWGTFRLTDEPVLEPPQRLRAAWADADLPPEQLWVPAHGETRILTTR